MSNLLEDLLDASEKIPPSHRPSVSDFGGVLAALVAHIEHGPKFLRAAAEGSDAVANLFGEADKQTGVAQPQAGQASSPPMLGTSQPPSPSAVGAAEPSELDRLRARLAELENSSVNVNENTDVNVDAPAPPPVDDRAELLQRLNSISAELARLDNPGGGSVTTGPAGPAA